MRLLVHIVVALACLVALPTIALAGSPHFVGTPTATISGDANQIVTVSAKEAGLGDEAQIVATLSGDAQCVNRGGNKPSASNKQSFATSAVIPVQNGKADYSISLAATFQPNCSPPMAVVWSNLTLTDQTNGITVHF